MRMRRENCLRNAAQILTLTDTNHFDRASILRLVKEQTMVEKVSPALAIQHGLLKPLIDYGLQVQLEEQIRSLKPVNEPEIQKSNVPGFIEITGFLNSIFIRIIDLRINASHIFKLTGHSRKEADKLRKELTPETYDIVRGHRKCQGTYVNFEVGIELCRKYGPPQLEKVLCSFMSIDAEDVNELDPGSGGSVTSRKLSTTQQDSRPVPSIRCAKDTTSSRQSRRNIRHSLLNLADPHSVSVKHLQREVWDSQPQLSELTAVKPDLKPSSWKTASYYGSLGDLFAPIPESQEQ